MDPISLLACEGKHSAAHAGVLRLSAQAGSHRKDAGHGLGPAISASDPANE